MDIRYCISFNNVTKLWSIAFYLILCIYTFSFSGSIDQPDSSDTIIIGYEEQTTEKEDDLDLDLETTDTSGSYNRFKTNISISSGIGSVYSGYGVGVSCNIVNRLGLDFDLGINHFPSASLSIRFQNSLEHYPISFNPGITIGYRRWDYNPFFGSYILRSPQRLLSLNIKICGYISNSVFFSNSIGLEYVNIQDNGNSSIFKNWDSNFLHTSAGIGYTIGGSPVCRNYRIGQKIVNVLIFIATTMAGALLSLFSSYLTIMSMD